MTTLRFAMVGARIAGAAAFAGCVAMLALALAGPTLRSRPVVRPPRPLAVAPPVADVSAIWKQEFNVKPIVEKEAPLRASVQGTIRGPAGSWAAVTGADGKQVVVNPGTSFTGAVVSHITASGVTLTSGSRTATLPVDRNSK